MKIDEQFKVYLESEHVAHFLFNDGQIAISNLKIKINIAENFLTANISTISPQQLVAIDTNANINIYLYTNEKKLHILAEKYQINENKKEIEIRKILITEMPSRQFERINVNQVEASLNGVKHEIRLIDISNGGFSFRISQKGVQDLLGITIKTINILNLETNKSLSSNFEVSRTMYELSNLDDKCIRVSGKFIKQIEFFR